MDGDPWLIERFEEHRSRLRAIAYRMLGSLSDADDAVQEAWLRSTTADATQVENVGGWLTTIVARVSLNILRTRRGTLEEPFEPRVPDPIVDPADGTDPEHEALLADAVGIALLVVLDTLSPPERLAYVLHDMFDVPFDEIAPIVDRSPQAARQLASRARRRIRSAGTPDDGDLIAEQATVAAFLAASREGDFNALIAVLSPDVVLRADFGPSGAGFVEVRGATAVTDRAKTYTQLGLVEKLVLVNGKPGVIFTRDGTPFSVLGFTVTAGRITAIDVLADPDRLSQLNLSPDEP